MSQETYLRLEQQTRAMMTTAPETTNDHEDQLKFKHNLRHILSPDRFKSSQTNDVHKPFDKPAYFEDK
jgi:hypothetical protein